MKDEKTSSRKRALSANPLRYTLLFVLLLGFLLVMGFVLNRMTQQPGTTEAAGDFISEKTLADQYGLRVNLIAVTAAGGLVDFRLKILDAEKARLLLQDNSDVPTLLVAEDDTMLTAPEDSTGQLINSLADDGSVFLLYPNVEGVLRPGMPVTVQFGEMRLEPIRAQ